jgi:hypothetical protein
VSLSADGNTAILGGPVDDITGGGPSDFSAAGAAWVFTRSGGVWTQQGLKLVGTGAVGAEQGFSVSLSADGNTAILGGPGDDGNAGAAWVFTRSSGVWTQQGPKLVGTGAVGAFSLQGYSVSLSGDRTTAVLGGPFDDQNSVGVGVGAAWVFTQPVFAGTPGKSNCHGQSVSALARQYRGLNGAAAALGYSDVSALQNAILTFCGQ